MSIQEAIYQGYGAAADVLGAPCQLYRPAGANNPLSGIPTTIQAAFDTRPDFSFKAPSTYAKPIWYGLFDATTVQVADYVVGPDGTYFVASLESLHPPMLIECNRTISLLRPHAADGVGVLPPGGDDVKSELPILTEWPCSLLQGTKGERGDVNLPGDVKTAWSAILLPAIPGVIINADDVLNDDLGRRHVISSTELTSLGWRLTAAYAGT